MPTAASTYEETRQRHVASALGSLGEHVARLDWPRDRIAQEQTAGLRSLLAIARERSAWHRERLAGVNPQTFDPAHLPSLPVMTKDDLMTHWDAIVTDPRLTLAATEAHLADLRSDAYLLDEYHAVASGGSSGRRGVFVWDWDGWALCYLGFVRWMLRAAGRRGSAGPPTMAIVAADMPTHMTSAVSQTFTNPATPAHRFPVTMPIAEIVAGLNAVQPRSLSGYPSLLFELAREARAGRLTISPSAVTATSEPLLPEVRAALEETFGAPVMNWWGTSEAGATGASCGFGEGMHLAEDLHIIEPVDDDYRPVKPGRPGSRVLLTNLSNPLQPLIRYEITDEVTVLDAPCPCGSEFKRVDDIQGRTDDCFSYAGSVVVHPHVFRSPLGRHKNVMEYQVRQTERGAEVDVRCASDADISGLQTELERHLRTVGLEHANVSVRQVTTIERTAAGKLARFVPLKPEHDGRPTRRKVTSQARPSVADR